MMTPTRLNLLSTKKQKQLQKMIYFQFIKSILEITLFVLSISGIALLGGKSILQTHAFALTEQIVAINNQHAETNKKIKNINHILKNSEEIQKNYIAWSIITAKITKGIPNDVVLVNLNLSKKDKSITLSGTAKTRVALLELKDSLENLELINKVNIPLSKLTEKENIPFSITAKLELE